MSNRIYRDAVTGRFVSKEYGQKHPKTTVSEKVARTNTTIKKK